MHSSIFTLVYIFINTGIYMRLYFHIQIPSRVIIHIHSHLIHIDIYSHIHIHTYIRIHIFIHTPIHIFIHKVAYTYSYILPCTYSWMHLHILTNPRLVVTTGKSKRSRPSSEDKSGSCLNIHSHENVSCLNIHHSYDLALTARAVAV